MNNKQQPRVIFDAWQGVSITLGEQHISRMNHQEVRSMVCTILVFGGKEFREEVKKWLNGETLESVASYLAPEQNADASEPSTHGGESISGLGQ